MVNTVLPGTWDRPASPGILQPYQDHLERRWGEGSRNATRLWEELVGLGFGGRRSTVRAWACGAAGPRRTRSTRRRRLRKAGGRPQPLGWPACSTADPAELPGQDRAFLDRLLAEAPALAEVRDLARGFAALVRKKGTGR